MDRDGKVVVEKRVTRRALARFMCELEPCLVGPEACGGAQHRARAFRAMGHDARLISPHFVKACVKSNENDFRDTEAVCEAVSRPSMRFVPVKAAAQRIALVYQLRGFLLEYGLVVAKGIRELRRHLSEILEDAENGLSAAMRELLGEEVKKFSGT